MDDGKALCIKCQSAQRIQYKPKSCRRLTTHASLEGMSSPQPLLE